MITSRTVVNLSAVIETATGIALIASPGMVGRVLLVSDLSGAGIAVGRVAGIALLALALACWTGGDQVSAPSVRALFAYNLLAGLYLGYLRVGGGFDAFLLWPACALHIVLALLLAHPTFARFRRAT
jgi:hypothetical protein